MHGLHINVRTIDSIAKIPCSLRITLITDSIRIDFYNARYDCVYIRMPHVQDRLASLSVKLFELCK